jgi:transposase-like protein
MRLFDVSDKTIRKIRRAANLPEVCRRLTPEEKAGIVAAIRSGESNVAIAERFTCDRGLVWKMARRINGRKGKDMSDRRVVRILGVRVTP